MYRVDTARNVYINARTTFISFCRLFCLYLHTHDLYVWPQNEWLIKYELDMIFIYILISLFEVIRAHYAI